jgi:hypothetical protein
VLCLFFGFESLPLICSQPFTDSEHHIVVSILLIAASLESPKLTDNEQSIVFPAMEVLHA